MEDFILVIGGAGYIGSHTTRKLLEEGRRVVVVDNLSTGHREVMTLFSHVYGPDLFRFEEVDILNREELREVFNRYSISGVIDFAAKSQVADSQKYPRRYFNSNVLGFWNLVTEACGIPIVKSSTAATYGDPVVDDIPLTEDYQMRCLKKRKFLKSQLVSDRIDLDTLLGWYNQEISTEVPGFQLQEEDVMLLNIPKNVYGVTKVLDELILLKASNLWKLKSISLRYFNAAGADYSRLLGEDHNPETHLIPILLQVALGRQERVKVFGDDYQTPDCTAVRDYISVEDLANAHVLCLDKLLLGGESNTYNLGSSKGFSVLEVIETARKVTGLKIPELIEKRRSGDPTILVADASRIRKALGWEAKKSLEEMVASAWHWHRLNPDGYQTVQEERFNPFWGRWINISANRNERPWKGETEESDSEGEMSFDPNCYLCPGNVRTNGQINLDYKDVWSFPNDFPVLLLDPYPVRRKLGPYAARASCGVCEVMNFSPNHSKRISTMEVTDIIQIIDQWTEIYERLGGVEEVKYPLIFENRGMIMGNSQTHPHSQVFAYGEIPDLMVEPQLQMFDTYRKESGGICFVCDANKIEIQDGRRIIFLNDHFAAYVPFAAQFPYDVVVVPLAHVASLMDFNSDMRFSLACILKQVLGGLDALFGMPYSYSMALIQTPTDGEDYGFHMQVHISSLLRGPNLRKHVVGADIFGKIINPSDPNVIAEEIRYAMMKEK